MIIDELNKKIADIESLANDKTSTIESKVSDLTDGLLMVADAVDIIPEMVDEKITAITKEFSTIKDTVSKVKAQKGDKGRDGIDGLDGRDGKDGKDGSPDKPKDIADKLNTLEEVLDPKVIKGSSEYVNKTDLEKSISKLQNQTSYLIQSNASKGTGGGGTWGSITGTLSAQTDLQTALDAKLDTVTTDATLTGAGTVASPLKVVSTSASDVAVTVRAATTATLAGSPVYDNGTGGVGATLTRGTNGVLPSQDGIALQVADRILVKNQSSTLQNGVYEVTSLGSASSKWVLTRTTDADSTSELDELVVTVSEGSTNRGTVWGQQTNNPVVGTSAIVFATVVSTAVTQATSGTQAIYQIPTLTGTARQITRGTANFKYNPTNDLFTIRGIDYTFPANNGDASQVLTTDGSGTLSWTTPSGGGSPITVGTSGNTLYSSGLTDTGQGDTSIGHNIFLGDYAGETSNSVSYSNLFGFYAGAGISGSIQHMNVFGRMAGFQANNSANSNFFGVFAGAQSTNSFWSNFIGADAGNNADQSFCANFIGAGAGAQSKNSAFSNFIGLNAGNNIISSYANDSIFIGTGAGASDNLSNYGQISYSSLSGTFTVGEGISSSSGGYAYIMFDNGSDLRIANVQGVFNINDTITGDDSGATANLDYFDTSKASILIGNNTSTGGFSNSIGLGAGATNTATNELMIGSASSPINTVVVKGTGGIQIPVGTTAERSATQGTIRYNTTTSKFEGYDGSTWVDLN